MRLIDADSIDYDDYWYNKGFSAIECQKTQQLINEQPTLEAITIPKGATNGDMIKAMFPYGKYGTNGNEVHVYGVGGNGCLVFTLDWWNASYK